MRAHIGEYLETDRIAPTSLGPGLVAWQALRGSCQNLILTSCAGGDITQPTALSGEGLRTLRRIYERHREQCPTCEA